MTYLEELCNFELLLSTVNSDYLCVAKTSDRRQHKVLFKFHPCFRSLLVHKCLSAIDRHVDCMYTLCTLYPRAG